MLKQLQKRKADQKGFTIIEVLIVLAIAGLILLIVFLAVPALQRNSRNTAARQDAGRLIDAANEFVSNNNGKLPAAASAADATTILNQAGSLGQFTLTGATATAKDKFSIASGSAAAVAALSTQDTAQLVTGATCDTSGATKPGNARQMALQYTLEGGSSVIAVCVDS